jgi:hypothetical protein
MIIARAYEPIPGCIANPHNGKIVMAFRRAYLLRLEGSQLVETGEVVQVGSLSPSQIEPGSILTLDEVEDEDRTCAGGFVQRRLVVQSASLPG